MPRYGPMSSALEPFDDPNIHIAEQYEESDRYVQDALDWASTHGDRHAPYVELCQALYRDSPEFWMTVEDIGDGEVVL